MQKLSEISNQIKKAVNDAPELFAVCVLQSEANSGVTGTVKLRQSGQVTSIKARVQGLKPGKHGFHIHEFGNLSRGCETAGGHYNPFKKQHGAPNSPEKHVGDLGNIIVSQGQDYAEFEFFSNDIKLSGELSVVGRAFVVHKDEDDLGLGGHDDSKTTGHAGARLACGVIGLTGVIEDW